MTGDTLGVSIGKILREAIDAGSGDNYFPVIAKHLGEREGT